MNPLKKFAVGAVIATASLAASALTLSFEDLPVDPAGAPFVFGNQVPAVYQGFNFSSADGTPLTSWYVATATPDFPAAPGGTKNITPLGTAPGSGPGVLDAFTISNNNGFQLQSMFFSGFGDVFIELIKMDGTSVAVGGFDDLTDPLNPFNPAKASVHLGAINTASATFNAGVLSGLILKEIVVWAQSDLIAVDDIVVTPIPEPSTYALMALGLAGIGFVARRRRMGDQV